MIGINSVIQIMNKKFFSMNLEPISIHPKYRHGFNFSNSILKSTEAIKMNQNVECSIPIGMSLYYFIRIYIRRHRQYIFSRISVFTTVKGLNTMKDIAYLVLLLSNWLHSRLH